MGTLKLSGAAWSWVGTTLHESAQIWRTLGVNAMDLIALPAAGVGVANIEADPLGAARQVREPGMELANLLYIFGADFRDRAVNSPHAEVRAKNRETMKRVTEFCAAAGIPSVIILPGVNQDGRPYEDSQKLAAEGLLELTALGRDAGVKVLFEPHKDSVLESPIQCLAFLQKHPELRIVLDHSHFVASGYGHGSIDPLIPYADHIHLRQGKNGHLQCIWDEGEIDFPAIIRQLQQINYAGYVAFEYENDPWLDVVDVMTETIKLRNAILPALAGAGAGARPVAKKIARTAAIGTGWWATTAHIPTLQNHPQAELVAIADVRPERLEIAAKHFGIATTYTDFREMLAREQLDGVTVAVWHAAHYEVAKACLEQGLHMVLEKPMVLTAKHAKELVDLARAKNLQIVMSYPWIYLPQSAHVRERIKSGRLGEIRYIANTFSSGPLDLYRGHDRAGEASGMYPVIGPGDVYSDPVRSGGGQGHLQVTHSASLMFYLTDLKPVAVIAAMDNLDVKVDVVDAMIVRMDNGALATVGSTGNAVGGEGKLDIQIYCDNGYVDLDYIASTGAIYYKDGTVEDVSPDLDAFDRSAPGANSPGSGAAYPANLPTINLIEIIAFGAENRSPVEFGWRTVEMLDAAYRSTAQNGREVTVASLYV